MCRESYNARISLQKNTRNELNNGLLYQIKLYDTITKKTVYNTYFEPDNRIVVEANLLYFKNNLSKNILEENIYIPLHKKVIDTLYIVGRAIHSTLKISAPSSQKNLQDYLLKEFYNTPFNDFFYSTTFKTELSKIYNSKIAGMEVDEIMEVFAHLPELVSKGYVHIDNFFAADTYTISHIVFIIKYLENTGSKINFFDRKMNNYLIKNKDFVNYKKNNDLYLKKYTGFDTENPIFYYPILEIAELAENRQIKDFIIDKIKQYLNNKSAKYEITRGKKLIDLSPALDIFLKKNKEFINLNWEKIKNIDQHEFWREYVVKRNIDALEIFLDELTAEYNVLLDGNNIKCKKELIERIIKNENINLKNVVIKNYHTNDYFIMRYLSELTNNTISFCKSDVIKSEIALIRQSEELIKKFDFLKREFNFKEANLLIDETKLNFELFGIRTYNNEKLFVWKYMHEGLSNVFSNIRKLFKELHYLPSVRGNTQRLYSFYTQGTDINSIIHEFLSFPHKAKKPAFIIKWLKTFFNIEDFEIIPNKEGTGSTVYIDGVNIADYGYGLTQVLPLLLKIYIYSEKRLDVDPEGFKYNPWILCLEEPETNLHPALQSKLADLFVDANNKFNIQFIIETHSEYLIRKLQYLTAKEEIKPYDSVIYYFYHPDQKPKGEKQVKKITIDKEGSLSSDFGPGFFDEATNWKFELLKVKNPQQN